MDPNSSFSHDAFCHGDSNNGAGNRVSCGVA